MRLLHIIALMAVIWVLLPAFTLARMKREKRSVVRIETTEGIIRVALYDDTPIHRDNFLAKVEEGRYDSLLFHRVIKDFMIQGGDPASRTAQAGERIGDPDSPPDTINVIPSEIQLPYYYHKRGALAAAREPDEYNPMRMSSDMQFYIVWGKKWSERELSKFRGIIEENTGGEWTLTSQMSSDYQQYGGTPHLDGAFTVFGEVVEGMNVVERIQQCITDANDRPLVDVRILRAVVEQKSKKAQKAEKR
ncbi:MAG: peptidylprolyl isomerase [Bacteroidaceae bacterium]|nr:peptidylprolyl isomerase [Bacteroidaceae bacterium]